MWKKSAYIITVALVAIAIIWAVSFNNSMINLQEKIEAKHKDNLQVYSSIRIKIEQAGLVANTYSDQVVRAIEVAIGKRYGGGGTKGAMIWIKEQNPTIDSATYTKVQQVIEAEFTRFEANQTTLLDIGRIYKAKLRKFPGNLLVGILGFSTGDIEPYLTVLTSTEAKRDYESGTMTAPNTFGN